MAESVRIVKKYQNRKLYDTQDSCYVTLDGIAKMIREGEEIIVVDNNTKEDVTALILTQVLYEQEKNHESVLPVPILKNIIQAGSNNLYEFMQKFILGAFDAYARAQAEIENHIEKLAKKGDLSADEALALRQQVRTLAEAQKSELDERIERQVQNYMNEVDLSQNGLKAIQEKLAALEMRATA